MDASLENIWRLVVAYAAAAVASVARVLTFGSRCGWIGATWATASSFCFAALSAAFFSSCCLNTTLSCSKKQKKIALLMPFENARGPTPVKKVLARPIPLGDSRQTLATAPAKDGRDDALHIIRVLTTSSGVVAPAATAPATRPIEMSAAAFESSAPMFVIRRCAVRIVSYAANLTAMSGTSSRSVGRYPVNIPLGPAALVIDRAATMTLGYTLACTDLMHTAAGTLTIELPSAPIPPARNAIVLTEYVVFCSSAFFAAP
mmetsp:Transcript_2252/g.8649  ORF Transcript_2252/g.8649 Transcript_2252/m.8649 type:complete len:260 (-) Transcript_2252:1053-1832(-)